MDFPPFFARYPFIDAANESVDGGIADKVCDDDLVSSFNHFFLSRLREITGLFRFRVLFGFVVRLVWHAFFCLVFKFQACCLLPVGYALFDAIDRVLKRK